MHHNVDDYDYQERIAIIAEGCKIGHAEAEARYRAMQKQSHAMQQAVAQVEMLKASRDAQKSRLASKHRGYRHSAHAD